MRSYLQRRAVLQCDSHQAVSQDNDGNGDAVSASGVPRIDDSDIDMVQDSCEPENDCIHPEAQLSVEGDSEVPPAQTEHVDANDLLVLALNFSLEFSLSWKAVEALQKLIAHILDRHDIPASKYLFKKQVGANIRDARFHFYCEPCMNLLAETSGDLQERSSLQQLSSLLSDKTIANALVKRLQSIYQGRAGTEVSDITDGSLYRELRQKLRKDDLTLTFNADGSPVFKSSKFSIWPIQLTVNELPPKMRHKNVVVSALWYGQSHPNMTLLLNSFVQQMRDLAGGGVTWMAGTDSIHSECEERDSVKAGYAIPFEYSSF
ncbi:hypothetical protein HPB49_009119 [Dermacentor silvarum]|uniref:Uncharacterized protein n=1 Tax=Dermacentor silvarum TaxID=543639 RepID=A0ACB8DY83_DERSI|nr:hypothetical protein HPB49_009119 [Dermacentor silvarum]